MGWSRTFKDDLIALMPRVDRHVQIGTAAPAPVKLKMTAEMVDCGLVFVQAHGVYLSA
jgi:hypothetical protein